MEACQDVFKRSDSEVRWMHVERLIKLRRYKSFYIKHLKGGF